MTTKKETLVDLKTFKEEMKFMEDLFEYTITDRQAKAYLTIFGDWEKDMFVDVCKIVARHSFKFPSVAMFYKVQNELLDSSRKFAGAK